MDTSIVLILKPLIANPLAVDQLFWYFSVCWSLIREFSNIENSYSTNIDANLRQHFR